MPKLWPLGQICLSVPYTYVRFLYAATSTFKVEQNVISCPKSETGPIYVYIDNNKNAGVISNRNIDNVSTLFIISVNKS